MDEVHKNEEAARHLFMDCNAWKNDGMGGWKRKPLDSFRFVTFEIIDAGRKYQPRVEWIGQYLKHGFRLDTLEEAKNYAWDCYKDILQVKTLRENEQPDARTEMTLRA